MTVKKDTDLHKNAFWATKLKKLVNCGISWPDQYTFLSNLFLYYI